MINMYVTEYILVFLVIQLIKNIVSFDILLFAHSHDIKRSILVWS